MIANDVEDLEAHGIAMESVDGYRPEHCAHCLRARPHGHGRRVRGLRAWCGIEVLHIELRRYRCPGCGALWTILPLFMARCLWRAWATVRQALSSAKASLVPARTRRRWRARLCSEGRRLVTVLTSSGDAELRTHIGALGVDATRWEVLDRRGGLGGLEALSSLVHRLRPGVRVM